MSAEAWYIKGVHKGIYRVRSAAVSMATVPTSKSSARHERFNGLHLRAALLQYQVVTSHRGRQLESANCTVESSTVENSRAQSRTVEYSQVQSSAVEYSHVHKGGTVYEGSSAPGALRGLVIGIVLDRGSSVSSRWAREYLTKLLDWLYQPFSRV
eukprot:2316812-Pyramimonas_sp.AAC.1